MPILKYDEEVAAAPSKTEASGHLEILFSDFFKVAQKTVEKYGAFDISLLADLPFLSIRSYFSIVRIRGIASYTIR